MWAIENQTPYAAERCFVRDRDGAEIWLVAVRATYDISEAGECTLAEKQDPAALAPQHQGAPGKSSLRCDMDLVRTKLGTDVLLNGSAYAPNGEPAPAVEVSLRVGSVHKYLVVHGERQWRDGMLGPSVSEANPFTECVINYETAYGGEWYEGLGKTESAWAEQNPVGIGVDTSDGMPAPQIEYPNQPLSRGGTQPAGFGAISCAWMPRRAWAGTYDEAWQRERQPLVPVDFQDEYFYSAPEDQQVAGFLKGGEEVELTNLTPGGRLCFRLPKVSLGFSTSIDSGREYHRSNLHTVLIEPDEMRLIMVWHTSLPCHHTLYTLRQTNVFEKKRTTASYRNESPVLV